jgi:hypothetical protein
LDEENHQLAGTRRANNASHSLYFVAWQTIFTRYPGAKPAETREAV